MTTDTSALQDKIDARSDMDLRLTVSRAVEKLQQDMELGNNVELQVGDQKYLVHDLMLMLREAIIEVKTEKAREIGLQKFMAAAEAVLREGDSNAA